MSQLINRLREIGALAWYGGSSLAVRLADDRVNRAKEDLALALAARDAAMAAVRQYEQPANVPAFLKKEIA